MMKSCAALLGVQRRVPQTGKLFCKKLFRLFPLPCEARHLAGGLLGLPESQPAGGVGNKAKGKSSPWAIRGGPFGLRRDDPRNPRPGAAEFVDAKIAGIRAARRRA